MKIRTVLAATIVFAGIIAGIAARSDKPLEEDFPRGALIYAETSDLPGLIDRVSDSGEFSAYTESANFREFKDRRLALRLSEWLKDLSGGIGSSIDSSFIKGLAEKRAAVAVYDIGRMDLVLVAPVEDSFLKASVLMASLDRFAEMTTDKGSTVYSIDVNTENGRERKQVMFALIKGRFVLATSEKLLVKAEEIITGDRKSGRLSDQDEFRSLADFGTGGLLRVWVDQKVLNSDYYYRRYWLSRGEEGIQDVRSGMFTIEIDKSGLVERRKYLLSSAGSDRAIGNTDSRSLAALVPEDAHFASARTAESSAAASSIRRVLFGDSGAERKKNERLDLGDPGEYFEYGGNYYGYEYLDSRFDQMIDEQEDEVRTARGDSESRAIADLKNALGGGRATLLEVLEPTPQPVPLFADFRRGGAVLSGARIDTGGFEGSVKRLVDLRNGVSGVDLDLIWKSERIGKAQVRSLELPMLGRSFFYSHVAGGIVFSNSRDLMAKMLRGKKGDLKFAADPSLSSSAIINVSKGKDSFETIFGRLDPGTDSEDLFRGNVASIFRAFPDLSSITSETSVNGLFAEKRIFFHVSD